MLNGVDPIMIFRFFNKEATSFLGKVPGLGSIVDQIGLPIPIYLSERWQQNIPAIQLSGIILENESRNIDLVTKVDALQSKSATGQNDPPEVAQQIANSSVSLSLVANRDSLLVNVFVALSEMILSKVASLDYSITYLSRSTIVFNGFLDRFQTAVDYNTDLLRVDMSLSNAKKEKPTPKEDKPFVQGQQNVIPIDKTA